MSDWIKDYFVREKSVLNRYGLSLLLLATSFVVMNFVSNIEQVNLSSAILGAVVLSAIHGGFGPAIAVSLIGALGLDFFYVAPIHSVLDSLNSFLRFFIFISGSMLVSFIVVLLRNSLIETENFRHDLQENHRQTNNLMAVIAHDLRNPIGAIKGFADLQRQSDTLNLDFIERIYNNSNFCLELIEDLQEFSSFRHSNFTLKPNPIDLNSALREVLESIQPLARKKDIQIVFESPTTDFTVKADKNLLRRAIQNIMDNAIKYSPSGTVVTIELTESQHDLQLKVSDQGLGIKEEEIKKIFTPFYKTPHKPTNGESSTGLGLASVVSILKAHQGEIKVSSQPGAGSCFTIHLPK